MFSKSVLNSNTLKTSLIAICLAFLLSACNYPGGEGISITATSVSARQTLYAGMYPSQTPVIQDNPQGTSLYLPMTTPEPLETAPAVTPSPLPTYNETVPAGRALYYSQSGETIVSIAAHFQVNPSQIQVLGENPAQGFLSQGTVLLLPEFNDYVPYPLPAMPDAEVLFSPTVSDLDIVDISVRAGGFLNLYHEILDGGVFTGPQIVALIARETSTNPRLLLAMLEFQSGWVYGHPPGANEDDYPLGFEAQGVEGLYAELSVVARELARGYYGWREGKINHLTFKDQSRALIAPHLNAGSVAIQYLMAGLYEQAYFEQALYGLDGFLALYERMFGDPFARAALAGPLIPGDLEQPKMTLPFGNEITWALTAGPHITWQLGTPRGAVDFAPVDNLPGCIVSPAWATASAPGLVLRSARGAVALDLDGDGDEGTGWVILYMHMAKDGRVQPGTWLNQDDPIGHPSCEGGFATGTHLHIARKYNGEWVGVEGPVPFVLDGWTAFPGPTSYSGTLVKQGRVVISGSSSKEETWIRRGE